MLEDILIYSYIIFNHKKLYLNYKIRIFQ